MPRRPAIALAVGAALFSGAAAAQVATTPYQSMLRESIGEGPGEESLPRGGVFQPRVEAAIQYVNNINLAENSRDEVNASGLELAPGFYASYSSDAITAVIDYSVIGRAWDESDLNEVLQRGAANGRWNALPGWFYLDAQGSVTDGVINPAVSVDYGDLGLFGQENLSQVATASASPTFDKVVGDVQYFARYSYGRVWYFDQGDEANAVGFIGQDDSRDQSINLSVGNLDSVAKLTGQAYYNWQNTDYDDALPYKYEQLGARALWAFVTSTSVVVDGGAESALDESTTEGGLGSSYWSVGFRWEPDDRTYLEARYGDRFFGSTYFFDFRRETRLLEFEASYDESPQVETQILSLGGFNPGELPPGTPPGIGTGRLNSDPFVGKNAYVGVTAVGSRTRVGLSGYRNVQDYIRNAQNDDTWIGGVLSVTRDIASNLSADFNASYTDYEQSQGSNTVPPVKTVTSDYDTQLMLRLNRTSSGGKLIMSLEAGYLNRSGSEHYDGWWTGLRARWTPGSATR
jgi:hypothetical protein